VYNKHVNWPPKGSTNDSLYFSYVTTRYQAYPNIIWDFSKEAYNEPNKDYERSMLGLIKSKDAYHRLLTVHDDGTFYANSNYNSILDFHTEQQHGSYYSTIINDRNAKNWPVMNSEYEYEWGPGGANDKTYGVAESPESVLKATYEVVMAGGYPGYYYTYHAWDIVRYSEVPAGLHYYGYLTAFFNQTKWYDLLPSDNLIGSVSGSHCLAKTGSEYLVYLSNGGSVTLTVAQVPGQISGTWMNAYTGQQQNAGPNGNGAQSLTAPWASVPSILWLHTGQTAVTPQKSNREAVRGTIQEMSGNYRIDIVNLQGRVIASFFSKELDINEWERACIKHPVCPGVYYARLMRNNVSVGRILTKEIEW
jgi:hypothetical protein